MQLQEGLIACNVLSSARENPALWKTVFVPGFERSISPEISSWTSLLYNSVLLNNAKRQKSMYTSTFVTSLWAHDIMVQVVSSITWLHFLSFYSIIKFGWNWRVIYCIKIYQSLLGTKLHIQIWKSIKCLKIKIKIKNVQKLSFHVMKRHTTVHHTKRWCPHSTHIACNALLITGVMGLLQLNHSWLKLGNDCT